MSKKDSSSDKETAPGGLASDTDPRQVAGSEAKLEIEASGEDETSPALEIEVSDEDETSPALEIEVSGEDETSPALEIEVSGEDETSPVAEDEGSDETETPQVAEDKGSGEAETSPQEKPDQPAPPKPRRSWFGLFNFLLILLLAGAAGYYWWQQQQVASDYETTFGDLRQQLEGKAGNARLDSSLSPIKGEISSLGRKIDELGVEQQGLRESSEKLYELYGRDKNDWQLAEVEYLMRVAQHKLILQDDFEGAAITLQAASDRIALTGDPGLLSVRVMISEEIADLKTRKRADLVGMTLILAQLRRQVRVLEPGFALRVDETPSEPQPAQTSQDWFDRFNAFIDSLVKVRNEATQPTEIEANITDVSETLEDNLKLARWAVLERDGRQYQRLIEQRLRLFREFYDLDNAANNDFMTQLQELQKMELKPEKPDITGSLRELLRILSQRESAPQPAATEAPEPDNG